MVVHYPRTVWKNSYVEHEVTGKTYKLKKKKKKKKKLTGTHCTGTTGKMAQTISSHGKHREFEILPKHILYALVVNSRF